MSELGKKILEDMQKIKNSLIELDKIALKPIEFLLTSNISRK